MTCVQYNGCILLSSTAASEMSSSTPSFIVAYVRLKQSQIEALLGSYTGIDMKMVVHLSPHLEDHYEIDKPNTKSLAQSGPTLSFKELPGSAILHLQRPPPNLVLGLLNPVHIATCY
jgi:hypothetical protein